ncbi:hypothetical protein [uncultured Thiocystis sp.]|uniref:hypothetical protein n=1 Tax=uncultured Thiocystis sp. TaxID=1202134 RepID=UPI0025E21FF7|nr:hypothetical protein [uncultured Thiocystis sp.]
MPMTTHARGIFGHPTQQTEPVDLKGATFMMGWKPWCWLGCCLWAAAIGATEQDKDCTGKIPLQNGWNFVSFSALPEGDHSPQRLLDQLRDSHGKTGSLRAILTANGDRHWTAEGTQVGAVGLPTLSTTCSPIPLPRPCLQERADTDCRASQLPALPKDWPIDDLQQIEIGQAYWIYADQLPLGGRCVALEGAEPASASSIKLPVGWTPLVLTGTQQAIPIADYFGSQTLEKVAGIVRWDPRNASWVAYDPLGPYRAGKADESSKEAADQTSWRTSKPDCEAAGAFQDFVPGIGYWVGMKQAVELVPQLHYQLSSQHSTEDKTQVLKFGPEQNTLDLFLNSADAQHSGGALTWHAEIQPVSDTKRLADSGILLTQRTIDDLKLLSLSRPTVTEPSSSDSQTTTAARQISLTGTVGGAIQRLQLQLDRRHLPEGRYLAELHLSANASESDYRFPIEIESTGLDGEWHGMATIETVNGYRNKVPDIDLVLQLFRVQVPGGDLTQVRGLIDSQETLSSWPRDAQGERVPL